ncbi:hypothetical protein O6H91_07G030200 [Diphasiastrum complanatum]|uniref:Uncharacterized protein n=1 Tax=Diphasiastrum complanatum TaxID=34168 RepID=A0ACC2D3K5_DIPCM|nr:hypothetical protein O6H91_07G030200 [Diphasiastrum complanatum]
MDQKNAALLFVIRFLVCLIFVSSVVQAQLRPAFYLGSCFGAESIVRETVQNAVESNPETAAGLIRMHFHDCFVNGCDGSVLIDSTTGNQAEKDSFVNNPSLHGFEVIDAAKQALETKCPGIVSCADILAFAARDSVAALGGPRWPIRSGRRDGLVSRSSDVLSNIPAPTFNLQQLTQNFNNKGLSQEDMITLSGAHTIGVSHCSSFTNRLYNFNSTTQQDPLLDNDFANKLKAQCPNGNPNPNTVVEMDSLTPFLFDNSYYSDVRFGRGLFTSDEALITDPNTKQQVQANSAFTQFPWRFKFPLAMIRMSEIGVLTGQQGEIRKNCHVINS